MTNSRSCSSCALIVALALAACHSSADGMQALADADGQLSGNPSAHHDAQITPDSREADATTGSGPEAGPIDGGPIDSGVVVVGGTVSCYSALAPDTTCALPTHCCFTNYSVDHAGTCDTAVCTWGTIECDGPEDCATGQRCCAHAIIDPDEGITGYKLACQADVCGAAPANVELCHGGATAADTCGGGRACVSAADQYYELPRTLSICQ